MKKYPLQSGFTLIETLIAIFILTLTIGGLLTLAANGYFSVRYSRNQIAGNGLLQESLEYIRNSRDTALQQGSDWGTWLNGLTAAGCTSAAGCLVDAYTSGDAVRACSTPCESMIFYPDSGVYGYANSHYPFNGQATPPTTTTYIRTIHVQQITSDQIVVSSSVQWLNGKAKKTVTQSIMIANWSLTS